MVPSGKERDDAFCDGVALYRKASRGVLFPRYSVSAHQPEAQEFRFDWELRPAVLGSRSESAAGRRSSRRIRQVRQA